MIRFIYKEYQELVFTKHNYLFYDDFFIIDDLEFNFCFTYLTKITL